jgi:hypothetical protein
MKATKFTFRAARLAAIGLLVMATAASAVTALAKTPEPAAKSEPAAKAAPATPAPRAANPHGDIALDCRLCHDEQDRSNANPVRAFDHATTGFVLEGRHAGVACNDCHRQPRFSHVGTQCVDCHLDAHKGRLGPDCSQCHTPAGWVERSQARRDHDRTRLPLVGAHTSVDCDACHTGAVRGEYIGTPFACYACHQPEYAATANPNHAQAGFGTDCERCHGVFAASWGRGDFVHSARFPLTGAHATIECSACHTNGFADTSTDCYACHQPDYDATVNPPHATAGMGTACAVCHSTVAWRPTQYDHAATGFPLAGGHSGVDCTACHQAGYTNTPTDCYACHRGDFEGTTDPNHVTGGFPTDCTTCHAVTRWTESNFDHARTSFPLTGAHTSQSCTECHASGYTNTPTDCYACHQTDYTGSTNPNHVTAGIPTTCATCHSTSNWSPATFNHNLTSFPLTGAHTAQSCTECHASGYTNTPTDCYACHQADYTGSTNPNHVTAGIPTTCATCHSTSNWSPATFNHNLTSFPLTGAHTSQSCLACHASGYTNTPTDCYACHQIDYNNTNSPDHAAASFPTACVTCHSTTAWTPSSWDHEALFPIETGKHRNLDCTQCHVNQNNYAAFECILCHEHNQQDTAGHHNGRPDYQWVSSACYSCHPRGR